MARILVVDDEEEILDAVKMRLNGASHDVVASRTASDIRGLVIEHEPDVVLLEMLMPRVRGPEGLKQLRGCVQT